MESGNNTLITQDHLNSFTFNQTTREIDDPIQKLAKDLGVPSFITNQIDANKPRDHKNDLKENSLYNISNKDSFGTNQTQISSSNLDANNNLTINANKDVVISASNLESNNSININAENLSILAATEMTQTTQENKTGRTLMFRNYNEMNANVSYVNSSLSAKDNDFNLNIQNSITTSFNSKNSEDLAYLNYLTQNKAEITTFTPQDNITLRTHDAVRGTTEAGNIAIIAGVIAISMITAGAAAAPAAGAAGTATAAGGATAAGAATATATATTAAAGATAATVGTTATAGTIATIGTATTANITLASVLSAAGSAATSAAITAASSTALIAATNSSMNAEGDFFKQLKDTTKDTIKTTTSEESIKNIAIAAGVAGVAAGALHASGGSASLEPGKDAVYKPSDKLIADNPDLFAGYNGVIDPSANNIGMANVVDDIKLVGQPITPYSTNPLTSSFWEGFIKEGGFISNNANQVGGMNSMSLTHDPISNNAIMSTSPILQLTIAPAIGIQYCATFAAACGGVVSGSMNNEFGTKR